MLKISRPEAFYQKVLENVLKGTHKRIPSGVTDVTTLYSHAEIKKWPKWRHAIGQLLSYNATDKKPILQVYLFNQYSKNKKRIALDVFKAYDILPYEFIDYMDSDRVEIIDLLNEKCVYIHTTDRLLGC